MLRTLVILLILIAAVPEIYGGLRIEEIYPAPAGTDEEWVELFNDSDQATQSAAYALSDEKDTPLQIPGQEIAPRGFIKALSHSTLNNSGDTVKLMFQGAVVETVTYPDISSQSSYVRCPAGWIISSSSSPLAANDVSCAASVSPQPSLSPTTDVTAVPEEIMKRLVIHEYLPYPDTDGKEWVELFNPSDSDVTLSGYYVDDEEQKGSSPFLFSADIPAGGYYVIYLGGSMLNNTADIVRLLYPDKRQVAASEYRTSQKGRSWGMSPDRSRLCVQDPSPGDSNNECTETAMPVSPVMRTLSPTMPVTVPRKTATVTTIVGKKTVLGASKSRKSIHSSATTPKPTRIYTITSDTPVDKRTVRTIMIVCACIIVILILYIRISIRRRALSGE